MYTIEAKKRVNSRKYSVIASFNTDDEVMAYLQDNKLTAVSTPYFFTHINLDNGQIIAQNYNGLMCSPVELAKKLNVK
jgi:hypothetical protein